MVSDLQCAENVGNYLERANTLGALGQVLFSEHAAHGSAIAAHATITTSESPKLNSESLATRNPTIAARVGSLVASAGNRRSSPIARAKNATQIQNHASRPRMQRSTRICSGVLCTCSRALLHRLRQRVAFVDALELAGPDAEHRMLVPDRQLAAPHVDALLDGRILGIAHGEESFLTFCHLREREAAISGKNYYKKCNNLVPL